MTVTAQVTTKGMRRVLPPRRALQTLTPITTDFFHSITFFSVFENPLIAINNILLVGDEIEYSAMDH